MDHARSEDSTFIPNVPYLDGRRLPVPPAIRARYLVLGGLVMIALHKLAEVLVDAVSGTDDVPEESFVLQLRGRRCDQICIATRIRR